MTAAPREVFPPTVALGPAVKASRNSCVSNATLELHVPAMFPSGSEPADGQRAARAVPGALWTKLGGCRGTGELQLPPNAEPARGWGWGWGRTGGSGCRARHCQPHGQRGRWCLLAAPRAQAGQTGRLHRAPAGARWHVPVLRSATIAHSRHRRGAACANAGARRSSLVLQWGAHWGGGAVPHPVCALSSGQNTGPAWVAHG